MADAAPDISSEHVNAQQCQIVEIAEKNFQEWLDEEIRRRAADIAGYIRPATKILFEIEQ